MKLKDLFPSISGEGFVRSGPMGQSIHKPFIIDEAVGSRYMLIEYGMITAQMQLHQKQWRVVEQSLHKHKGRFIDEVKIETRFTQKNKKYQAVEVFFFDISAIIDQLLSYDPEYDLSLERKRAMENFNNGFGAHETDPLQEYPLSAPEHQEGHFGLNREWKGAYQPSRTLHTIKTS